MTGLPDGQKSFKIVSHFDTIPACDGHPASHVTQPSILRRAGKKPQKRPNQ